MIEHEFTAALATSVDQPMTVLRAFETLVQKTVGAKLLTLTTVEPTTGEAARIFSNLPKQYPVAGRKPADETDWSRQVLRDRKTFVANTIKDIAAVFPDYELIRSLGCESVVNVPVEVAGKVIGTINLLHEAGYYTPERVAQTEHLRLSAAMCFLLCQHLNDQGVPHV